MDVTNIKIDNENEEVELTLKFDCLEFQDIRYILNFNETQNSEFEHMNIKFLDSMAEDGIGDDVNALLIEVPPMRGNQEERLNAFINFLYKFCYIKFPWGKDDDF